MELSLLNTASPPLALAIAFFFGLLTSFTPCVYPLIPITIAIFSSQAANSRKKTILLALTYTAGMALIYTTLGMISALTGQVFGQMLGNPILIWILIFLMSFLSLLALEIIKIDYSHLQNKASLIGGGNYSGTFLMGAVSGVVAAPCVGPALIAILSIAATSPSILLSSLLLLSYSLGLGVLFIVLALFSRQISFLPKSGIWLNFIKFIIASLVLMVAFFLGKSLLASELKNWLLEWPLGINLTLIMLALLFAYFLSKKNNKWGELCCAGVLAFAVSNLLLLDKVNLEINWQSDFFIAQQQANSSNRILMADLSADWCLPCKMLAEQTFMDPTVTLELKKLVLAKIDFTSFSKQSEYLSKKYQVPGVPCVLFLDPEGNEIPNTRITGFVNAQEFLEILKKIKID